jgi:Zn-dependent protease
MNLFHFEWETVPFRLIAFVIAFTLHEWAHAFVAWRLGDPTAQREGRLTLNPIPHIDPFGLILILFGPFGWARPVPVNPYNFRGNKRLGMVYVAAAGPFVNLILAVVFGTAIALMDRYQIWGQWSDKMGEAVWMTLWFSLMINCGLFVFNLLPIHPLDGSNILRFLASRRWDPFFHKLDVYGPWLLLLLIFLPGFSNLILGIPLRLLMENVMSLANLLAAMI